MNVYTACVKSFLLLSLGSLAQAEEQAPVLMQTSPMASGGKVVLFLLLVCSEKSKPAAMQKVVEVVFVYLWQE